MKKFILNIAAVLIVATSYGQTLQDYQASAARENQELQAAYKDFEIALKEASRANALADPQLSFGYFISPIETRVGPQNAKIGLSQMFPWFGTLRAREETAALIAESKYQDFLEARNRLYYEVARNYFPILESQKLIALQTTYADELTSYKRLSTNHFSGGHGTMVNVLRVDVMLKQAQTDLKINEQNLKSRQAALNAVLNRPPDSPLSAEDSLDVPPLAIITLDTLGHPALAAHQLLIDAAVSAETSARKDGLPRIGVGMDYVFVGNRSDMIPENNGKNAFMPMVSVSVPVFRKKYRAAREISSLLAEKQTLLKDQLKYDLQSAIAVTTLEISNQQEKVELASRQIETLNQAIRLLFSHYSESGEDFEEVLRMREMLLENEKMRVKALAGYLEEMEKLNYLLGNQNNVNSTNND